MSLQINIIDSSPSVSNSIETQLLSQVLLVKDLNTNLKIVGLKLKRARPLKRSKKILASERAQVEQFLSSNLNIFKTYKLQLVEAKKELLRLKKASKQKKFKSVLDKLNDFDNNVPVVKKKKVKKDEKGVNL